MQVYIKFTNNIIPRIRMEARSQNRTVVDGRSAFMRIMGNLLRVKKPANGP